MKKKEQIKKRMKNLTFVEYLVTINSLEGCIILAEHIWNPYNNEDEPFWDFCYSLLGEIFSDYRKEYDETEDLLHGIEEIVYVSKMIEKQAWEKGRKEREKREANTPVYL